MRAVLLSVSIAMLAACNGDEPGIPDEPNDPFPGLWEHASDFPRDHCTPGSLHNLVLPSDFSQMGLRLATDDLGFHAYRSGPFDDHDSPYLLTDDDLIVRTIFTFTHQTTEGPVTEQFIEAIDVCGVDEDGTIHGSIGTCSKANMPEMCADMFDPLEASPLHRLDGESEGEHLSLVGEFHGDWPGYRSLDIRVDGDIAYLANSFDGVRIISIASPAAPVELGHFEMGPEYVNDLEVVHANGRTYVVAASNVGRVIDVTDPANPALITDLPVFPHTVMVENQRAYFATGSDGQVPVFDLTDPRAPSLLGTWDGELADPEHQPAYHDLYISNGIGYLSNFTGGGLDVVNFTDPAHPIQIGQQLEPSGPFGSVFWHCPWLATVGTQMLAFDGDEGTGVGLKIYDGDPASPSFLGLVGAWQLRDDTVSIHNIMVFGTHVYMSHYQDGVRVLDVSNPANPVQVGYFNTWVDGSAPGTFFAGAVGIDVDVARKRIYIADITRGLMILQGDATVFP